MQRRLLVLKVCLAVAALLGIALGLMGGPFPEGLWP